MYTATSLVDGFPAKAPSHGAFGWSSLWLISDGTRRILIDTGPPAYVPLITEQLALLGIGADDITDVLLTHLHWDHISNITMFPKADVWVGRAELAWAVAQPPGTPFMSDLHSRHLSTSGVRKLEPGTEILPGISVLATPGHTPGHLAFRVQTIDGPLLFAGDSVKNIHELATLSADSTLDANASEMSIRMLQTLMRQENATLIPGHDVPLILRGHDVIRQKDARAEMSVFADPESPAVPILLSTAFSLGAQECLDK